MKNRIIIALVCVPYYGIALIGEWYEATGNGRKFKFREFNTEYWREVGDFLRKRGG